MKMMKTILAILLVGVVFGASAQNNPSSNTVQDWPIVQFVVYSNGSTQLVPITNFSGERLACVGTSCPYAAFGWMTALQSTPALKQGLALCNLNLPETSKLYHKCFVMVPTIEPGNISTVENNSVPVKNLESFMTDFSVIEYYKFILHEPVPANVYNDFQARSKQSVLTDSSGQVSASGCQRPTEQQINQHVNKLAGKITDLDNPTPPPVQAKSGDAASQIAHAAGTMDRAEHQYEQNKMAYLLKNFTSAGDPQQYPCQ